MTTGTFLQVQFFIIFPQSVTLVSPGPFLVLLIFPYELQQLLWQIDLCDLLETTGLQYNSSLINFTNVCGDL